MRNPWLVAAGSLSTIAALLHLACIVIGPRWYRTMGAGARIVRLAEQGSLTPALITFAIATMLLLWAAYAFSGAGILPHLPLLRTGLAVITAIYLARAAAYPWMLAHMQGPGRSATFLAVTSIIVLVFGIVHAIGLWTAWPRLSPVV